MPKTLQPKTPSSRANSSQTKLLAGHAQLVENLQKAGQVGLANADLQNILQKQQQTLQMLSNISKMLSDTAMAVVRKMGS